MLRSFRAKLRARGSLCTAGQHPRSPTCFLSNLCLHHLLTQFLHIDLVGFLTVGFISTCATSSFLWEDLSSFKFNFHLFHCQFKHILRWLLFLLNLYNMWSLYYAVYKYITWYKSFNPPSLLLINNTIIFFKEGACLYFCFSVIISHIFYVPQMQYKTGTLLKCLLIGLLTSIDIDKLFYLLFYLELWTISRLNCHFTLEI